MKQLWEKLWDKLSRYPKVTHIILALWNAFIASWATKAKIPLYNEGIPFTIDASAQVAWLQAHLHISTFYIAVITFLLNSAVGYINWRRSHPKVVVDKSLEVAVQAQKLANEAKSVAAQAIKVEKDQEP